MVQPFVKKKKKKAPVCFKANISDFGVKKPSQKIGSDGGKVTAVSLKEEKKRGQTFVYSSHFPRRSHSLQPHLAQQTETVFITRAPSPLRPERRCLPSGFSCLAPEHSGALEVLRGEQQVGQPQAGRVRGRGLKEEERNKHSRSSRKLI